MTTEVKKYENKDNTGALFDNRYKTKDSQPNKTGTITINGEALRVSAWSGTSKKGNPYISVRFATHGDYSNRGEGVLFMNSRKEQSGDPDMTGTATIDGTQYYLNALEKVASSGLKYHSLKLVNKDDLYPMGVGKPEIDDEIPY